MGKSDLDKSSQELIKILDKKLEDKKVKANCDEVIRIQGLPRCLSDEVKSLYKKYNDKYEEFTKKYSDYKGEQLTKASITFYSNYVALKRIGEVCNEILEKSRKKKQIDKDEFIGALKSAELAKEQKKFTLKVEANKFGNDEGEIKLSEILNCSKVVKGRGTQGNDGNMWVNGVKTPFGNIDIKYFIDQGNNRPNVYIYPENKHNLCFSYAGMAEHLDKCCKTGQSLPLTIASTIKQYLNQKVNRSLFADDKICNLDSVIKCERVSIKIDTTTAENAAVLCGCLLFAESCDVRNPTRGKWEKKAIDKVIAEIKKDDCTNPFQTVFSGGRALYSPAVSRGMNPSSWLITGKVDITRDFPDSTLLRVFQQLNHNHITKDTTCDTFLKDVEEKNLLFDDNLLDDDLLLVHSIWSSDKLSKSNKIKVADLIQLLRSSKAKKYQRSLADTLAASLSDHRKRLADLCKA